MGEGEIDRLYRSLFVYTIGFYELLKITTKGITQERLLIQSKIWKVF